ncbi:MAG: hypothetical protein IT262_13965, partial [Saprospiraceae bacterium]|nr:hypothetical protein [Saprospiraceae bacterium]
MMNRFLLLFASAFILPFFRADAQCLPKISCDTLQPFCDVSDNDAAFWNAAPCWSQLFQSHDLPEGAVPLRFAAYDTCGTATVGFTLYLDLNGDGFQETAVQHSNLLTGGRLMFNNVTQPGMISGDTILFDARPVSDDLRFHFALKTEHAGDSLFASVVWENADTTVAVQFPFNQHRIVWWTEQDNERDSCIQDLKIRDCEPPVVSCITEVPTVYLPLTCMQTVWPADLIAFSLDNYTPGTPKLGLRLSGQGTGFPIDPVTDNPQTTVTFTGCDQETNFVEVWAMDLSGNVSMCETNILVVDNSGTCECFDYLIEGSTCVSFLPQGDCVEYAEVTAEATYQNSDTLNLTNVSNTSSPFTFLLPIGPPAKVVITPYHNEDPLNGVSTYDAVLMQKHILNIEPLNSPYKMIAADINRSGAITTFDIVLMRRVLLGIDQNFYNNTSWRFVPRAHVFPTANPFDPPAFPETITLYN